MGQGEHLRRLEVGVVHKDERRIFVHQSEALKFVGIELAPGIVADHAVECYEDAGGIGAIPQMRQGVRPGGARRRPVVVQQQGAPHCAGGLPMVVANPERTDEIQRLMTGVNQLLTEPLLSPLHRIYRLQQVGAGAGRRFAGAGAEIPYRQFLCGREG